MTSKDLPVSLRPAPDFLGPIPTAAQRIDARLEQIEALSADVRALGGHRELFARLAEILIDMRLEGEALKQRVGLPNAADDLSRIRSDGALRAKEVPALA